MSEFGTWSTSYYCRNHLFNVTHEDDYIYHRRPILEAFTSTISWKLSEKEKEHYPRNIDQVAHVFPEYYVLKVSGSIPSRNRK